MDTALTQQKELFPTSTLKRLLIPLIIEQLLSMTIGMADTVMVTRVGEAAVSGVSLVDAINILIIQVFAALATGGAVVAAQYLGRRDTESACSSAKQLIHAAGLVS
ncbi:MAG: MATE family efflux transporter, partial [Oscillospiraceae bacterium]